MLTSYEKGSDRYEYSYNEDGLRVEKKYYFNNVLQNICTYVWENGKLIAQKQFNCTNNDYLTITYLYDGEEAIGFVYDGLTFYYIKNIQGDVTAIAIADSGKLALTISYDAWGTPSYSIVVDDNAGVWEKLAAFLRAAGIMGLNNYTYRGYFYDTETGLYYLQSRYYDPEVGRFINLDEISIASATTGEILGTNLFAYCSNNSVNYIDCYGFKSTPVYDINYDTKLPNIRSQKSDYVYMGYKPTVSDKVMWCLAIIGANKALSALPNGAKFYLHFLYGSGDVLFYDYDETIREDDSVNKTVLNELNILARCVESKGAKSNYDMYRYEYFSVRCSSIDWRFAINEHSVNIAAHVTYSEGKYLLDVCVVACDLYNFSKSKEFVPFNEVPILKKFKITTKSSGRFVEVGLGVDFISYGIATYKMSWLKGKYSSTLSLKSQMHW